MTAWAVGGSKTSKRIHRPECRHARHPYNWAANRTEAELVAALVDSGAVAWHDACRLCAWELDNALSAARRSYRIERPPT